MKWETRRMADVADFCLGKMLDENKNKGAPLPYLANINVRWGEFDLENLREMRFEPHEQERYGLKFGDIVMCEGGEPGRCAIWRDAIPGMMIQKALHRIRPHDFIDHSFLYYSFLQMGRAGGFGGLLTGSTIKHLPREKLAKLEISFPPLSTQQRIASQLAPYDDLIENNRRRIQLLEESARLLYREWFVHLRFPGHEHNRIVDGLPEGWEKRSLESVCSSGDGVQTGPFGSQLHQADYSDEGVPVIMPKDIVDCRISVTSIARIPEALADSLGRHRMAPGDIVYGRRGDIGRRAYIGKRHAGWFCGTGCLRFRPNLLAINPLYLFDTLGVPDTLGTITNRAKGSTMPNLSAGALKSVPLLVASRRLQDIYVERVEVMREALNVLDEQNQKLAQARDLLLPRLMSGAIHV
jgi:type I restriction enzyme S subunit